MFRKSVLFFIAILLFCGSYCGNTILMAQKNIQDIKENIFKIVEEEKDITNGLYVIMGYLEGNTFLMTPERIRNKLKGKHYPLDNNIVRGVEASELWQIEREGNRISLFNINKEKYLAAKSEKGTDLALTTKKSHEWTIKWCGGNRYHLLHSLTPTRTLGTNCTTSGTVTFGNYMIENYPRSTTFVVLLQLIPKGGKDALLPTGNDSCALGSSEWVMADDKRAVSVNGMLLTNGKVAPTKAFQQWGIEKDDDGLFALHQKGKGYLNYNLSHQETPCLWEIRDKCIVSREQQPRTLVCNGTSFLLLTPEERQNDYRALTVGFYDVMESATYDTTDDGVFILHGGWTREHLSKFDFTLAHAIDLRHIPLPLTPLAFEHLPDTHHTIIYTQTEESNIPNSWRCVVNEGDLLHEMKIEDEKELYIPYPFYYKQKQLNYERHLVGDGRWETLVLPFDALVPPYIRAEQCEVFDGRTVAFMKTDTIRAHSPVIIRPMKKEIDKAMFAALKDNEINLSNTYDRPFKGTYKALHLSMPSDAYYFLDATGRKFTQASIGSMLPPFRAFLYAKSPETTSIRLLHIDDTSIYDIEKNPSQHIFLRLNGTKVDSPKRGEIIINPYQHKKTFYNYDYSR